MLATGTYQRALDDKLRLLLPKPVRAMIPESEPLYATPGTEQCLELLTCQTLRGLVEQNGSGPGTSPNGQRFRRLFYSRAEVLELDKQHRIRIPTELAARAELTGEVALVGVGTHFELWSWNRWQAYLMEYQETFDETHALAFGGSADQPITAETRPFPTRPR